MPEQRPVPGTASPSQAPSGNTANHKAGFVVLAGRPNAGKSTLLNALLKQKLSIVSSLPQTTRHKILGILNGDGYQLCFVDTPGLLDEGRDGLQQALIRTARIANREDADLLLLLVEPKAPSPQAVEALRRLARPGRPWFVVVNKSDLVPDAAALQAVAQAYRDALSPDELHVVSALHRRGVDELLRAVVARLPESPPYYGTDQVSDRWERFFVEELIREKIFELYHEEIPHACAVKLEEFREGRPDRIEATVFVEREPQKGILIGSKGAAIRRLTEESLRAIQAFLSRPAALELRVKVRQNWRRDPRSLQEFGYT